MTIPITEPWFTYPPELNAGRLQAGAGTFTWDMVANAWDQVAAITHEQMGAIAVEAAMMLANWQGLSGIGTIANTAPYIAWLGQMGANASKNAAGARWVVATYGRSNATMIPTYVIAQNRAQAAAAQAAAAAGTGMAALFPPAAAQAAQAAAEAARLEAEYGIYWQQNAATMTDYDAEISEATAPVPVTDPPKITNNGGTSFLGGGSNYRSNYNPSGYQGSAYKPSAYNPAGYKGASYTPAGSSTYKPGDYTGSSAYKGGSYTPSSYTGTTSGKLPGYSSKAYDPSKSGFDFGKYTPGTYATQYNPSDYKTSDYSSSWNPSDYEGSEYTPYIPGAYNANGVSGASAYSSKGLNGLNGSSAYGSAGKNGLSTRFGAGTNSLGRVGSIAGAGGLRPTFGTSSLKGATATGGLGLPGAKGAANSSNAFGGVKNAAAANNGRMGSGMGMFPPGRGGGNKKTTSAATDADIKDEDSNVLEGISVVQINDDPALDEAYNPDEKKPEEPTFR